MCLFCQHVCGSVRVFRQQRLSKEALIRAHLHLLAYPHTGRVRLPQINPSERLISLIGTLGRREDAPNTNSVWRRGGYLFRSLLLDVVSLFSPQGCEWDSVHDKKSKKYWFQTVLCCLSRLLSVQFDLGTSSSSAEFHIWGCWIHRWSYFSQTRSYLHYWGF